MAAWSAVRMDVALAVERVELMVVEMAAELAELQVGSKVGLMAD